MRGSGRREESGDSGGYVKRILLIILECKKKNKRKEKRKKAKIYTGKNRKYL